MPSVEAIRECCEVLKDLVKLPPEEFMKVMEDPEGKMNEYNMNESARVVPDEFIEVIFGSYLEHKNPQVLMAFINFSFKQVPMMGYFRRFSRLMLETSSVTPQMITEFLDVISTDRRAKKYGLDQFREIYRLEPFSLKYNMDLTTPAKVEGDSS